MRAHRQFAVGNRLRINAQLVDTRTDFPLWSEVEWGVLFSGAGLDLGRFVTTPPETIPPMSSDARLAWIGTYEDGRMERVRVEAASWQNRPVFFDIQLSPVQQARALTLNPIAGVAILSLLLVPLNRWRCDGLEKPAARAD